MKLMLVDDEPDILHVYRRALEKRGYSVDMFLNPLVALEQFQPGKYDLALLDVRMPDMNGLELAKKLAEKDLNLRIVFLSAFDFYALRNNYPSLSAKFFLNKPLSVAELDAKLKGFLEEPERTSPI